MLNQIKAKSIRQHFNFKFEVLKTRMVMKFRYVVMVTYNIIPIGDGLNRADFFQGCTKESGYVKIY